MKNTIAAAVLLLAAITLPAQEEGGQTGTLADYFTAPAETRHNEPIRRYELGFGGGGGFANNLLSIGNWLSRSIVLDLNQAVNILDDNGMGINLEGLGYFFVNLNLGENWGVGLFFNLDGRMDINLPKSFFTLLAEGNLDQHDIEGDVHVFGAIFAEAGVGGYMNFGKLRVDVKPAWYLPLVYIPKSGFHYSLETENALKLSASSTLDIYSPYPMNSVGSIRDWGGLDLSLAGEYALFPILDLGTSLSHIPLAPARLTHKRRYALKEDTIFEDDDLFDGINEFTTPEMVEKDYTGENKMVLRPLRFDTYALFRPLRTDFLVVRPNLGFTAINPSGETYFNWGLEGRLNPVEFFTVYLTTGREEGLWRHRLGLGLNVRYFEMVLEGAMSSQNFAPSFMGRGFSANLGLRFGY